MNWEGRAGSGEQEQDYTFKEASSKWRKKKCVEVRTSTIVTSPPASHHSLETKGIQRYVCILNPGMCASLSKLKNMFFQKTNITASGPITSWQIDRQTVKSVTLFSWIPKSLQMKLKDTYSLEEKLIPT